MAMAMCTKFIAICCSVGYTVWQCGIADVIAVQLKCMYSENATSLVQLSPDLIKVERCRLKIIKVERSQLKTINRKTKQCH